VDVEGVLAIVLIFGGGTLFLLAISPVGRAFADRIRGRSAAGGDAVSAELMEHREQTVAEIDALRQQVGELAERLDFAERMLAKQKDADRLAPPR
jgi:hypothetical protein